MTVYRDVSPNSPGYKYNTDFVAFECMLHMQWDLIQKVSNEQKLSFKIKLKIEVSFCTLRKLV